MDHIKPNELGIVTKSKREWYLLTAALVHLQHYIRNGKKKSITVKIEGKYTFVTDGIRHSFK